MKGLIQEVQEILTINFQTEIKVKSVEHLSEETRRNLVLRIYLEATSNKIPKTIIFKQSLIEKSLSEDDKLALGRFARDWAGLEFISSFDTQGDIAPRFYGGSIKSRFILLEDLGNHLSSLVDPLMSNDKSAAVAAINRYMVAMAKFHRNSHQHIHHYQPILKKIYPDAELWRDR